MKTRFKTFFYRLSLLCLFVLASYGLGRLYFHLTGGFRLANISSDFSYNPEWEVRPLSVSEQNEVDLALNQSYHYLGKGCQSYAFLSDDGQYVIKFFKYQRFRLQPWINHAPPLPALVKYRQEKLEKKWKKLNGFVKSWKVAFENLKEETGLVFVHLNKTDDFQKQLLIYDKIGSQHRVDLDQMEFCIQYRAQMLCDALLEFKKQGETQRAQQLISDLLALILSEYQRGLADNDHALMQNTGVVQGRPIHIDVGQFVHNEAVKEPAVYNRELYTKMYKFKLWLKEHYPEMAAFLDARLNHIIGPAYAVMQPNFRSR